MFKRIPYLTRAELRQILDRAIPLESGCLILPPLTPLANPNVVYLRGQAHTATRVVWAETRGDANLHDHEVVHRACCPHAGGSRGLQQPYAPLCINVEHLHLALRSERVRLSRRAYTRREAHLRAAILDVVNTLASAR